MHLFQQILGDTVKKARKEHNFTQFQVAEKINADPRTILNIENYKGNPKMEVLFPLIRILQIDAREIFNPEMKRDHPAIRQLRFIIEDCSETEAAALTPIITTVLQVLRANIPSEMK